VAYFFLRYCLLRPLHFRPPLHPGRFGFPRSGSPLGRLERFYAENTARLERGFFIFLTTRPGRDHPLDLPSWVFFALLVQACRARAARGTEPSPYIFAFTEVIDGERPPRGDGGTVVWVRPPLRHFYCCPGSRQTCLQNFCRVLHRDRQFYDHLKLLPSIWVLAPCEVVPAPPLPFVSSSPD